MQLKNIEKELDADIRNKLTLPRTILELISKQEKDIDKKHVEKAIKDLDEISQLMKKWFEKLKRKTSDKG